MRVFSFFLFFSLSLTAASCPFSAFDTTGGALIIQDADSAQIVATCGDVQKAYKYASNIKLLTTVAALSFLGRDYHFTTEFIFNPHTRVLDVVSNGDPSMVIEQLGVISWKLQNRGVKKIDKIRLFAPGWGKIVEREQIGAGRGDRAYQAPISALSLNFNTVAVSILPSKKGKKPSVSMAIPQSVFVIENKAVTVAGAKNSLVVSTLSKNYKTVVRISGSIGAQRTKPVVAYRRIYHPAHHYFYTLLTLMKHKMVPIEIVEKVPNLTKTKSIVYLHKSRPLHDILTDMNRYSNNFMAETVMRTIGIKQTGHPKEGLSEIRNFIKQQYGFTPNIINGSGLGNGEGNKITPLNMIIFLQKEWHNRWNSIDLFSTLPLYGETGTMGRVPQTTSNGNIRAKTGTLFGTSAASGIFRGKSGRMYVFTVILADKKVRRLTTTRNHILSKLVQMF